MVHVLGGIGTILVLGAYFLVSTQRIASRSLAFQGMNLVGAVLLAIYGVLLVAWASVVLNVVWAIIGAAALWRMRGARG